MHTTILLLLTIASLDSEDSRMEILSQFAGTDIKIFFAAYSHYHLALKKGVNSNDSPFVGISKYANVQENDYDDMAKINVNGEGFDITIGRHMMCGQNGKKLMKCKKEDSDTSWLITPASFGYLIEKNKKCITKGEAEALLIKKCTGDDDQLFDFKTYSSIDKCDAMNTEKNVNKPAQKADNNANTDEVTKPVANLQITIKNPQEQNIPHNSIDYFDKYLEAVAKKYAALPVNMLHNRYDNLEPFYSFSNEDREALKFTAPKQLGERNGFDKPYNFVSVPLNGYNQPQFINHTRVLDEYSIPETDQFNNHRKNIRSTTNQIIKKDDDNNENYKPKISATQEKDNKNKIEDEGLQNFDHFLEKNRRLVFNNHVKHKN
ncbi:hypothetical protein COBT_003579 [Conglomerata obtusa]